MCLYFGNTAISHDVQGEHADNAGRPGAGRALQICVSSFGALSHCVLRRVHTLAMPVVQELAELYRSVDCAASVTLLAKLAIEKSYSAKLEETRNAIQVILGPINQQERIHARAGLAKQPSKCQDVLLPVHMPAFNLLDIAMHLG